MRRIELAGNMFGSWTVLSYQGSSRWLCRCLCGAEKEVLTCNLRSGQSTCCRACGSSRHGESLNRSPEYTSYMSMKSRCLNKNYIHYENYGGRGIAVCDRWLGKGGFEKFLEDMGRQPGPEYTIERIDNDGSYEPSNCRWATRKEQGRNRRTNRLVTAFGEELCIVEWSERFGVHTRVITDRIDRGWEAERAVSQPAKWSRSKSKSDN